MDKTFSKNVMKEYLPVVQAISASIEAQFYYDKGYNKLEFITTRYLEKDFNFPKIFRTMKLISLWLKGSSFSVNNFNFNRSSEKVSWLELSKILNSKLADYHNDKEIIVLNLSLNGLIYREAGREKLTHKFEKASQKVAIINLLLDHKVFMKAEEIRVQIKSKSPGAVRKTIGQTNSILESQLQLPKKFKLIESDRRTGYRINPIYNIIRIRN